MGMCVKDREIQHHIQAFGPECIHIFLHDVPFKRAGHYRIISGLGIPDAESAVMFGSKTAIGHACGFGSLGPLAAIKFPGIEKLRRGIRVRPVFIDKSRHVEMDEHAEAQIHKTPLESVH